MTQLPARSMTSRLILVAAVTGWAVSAAGRPPVVAAQGPAPSSTAEPHHALVQKYCVSCHSDQLKTGDLTLEQADIARAAESPEVWEKVVRKVRVGMMPPQGAPQPDRASRDALVSWLTTALDQAQRPEPGRTLVRRLNRTEYGAAIRDLLDLEIDPATLLPADDSAYGFDNVADVLSISPVLLERYLSAAGTISALAVGDPDVGVASQTFRIRQDASQDRHVEGLPVGTAGGLLARTTLPLDGDYVIQARLFRTNLGAMRGLEYEHQIEITVDGARVHLARFGGEADFRASLANPTVAGDDVDGRTRVRLPLTAGPHEIGVAFIEKSPANNSWRLQPFVRSSHDTFDPTGYPHLDVFTVTGPYDATGPGDTPSRRKVFTCRPASARDDDCATRIVSTLARQAYRGQETADDLRELMQFYARGAGQGGFERGVQLALQRMLASAKFVLRVERDPRGMAAGTVHAVTDLELASRLSFFLWSSLPDEELLRTAAASRLRRPADLRQQMRRMLADPRSARFVANFAGQWLYLRNLKNMVPLSTEFVDFDDNLRRAFEQEALLFFDSIVREDHSVVDLMRADHTFVNERLARHYGLPEVYGSQFRRVTLTDEARKGLLGKGAVLMVTSHTDRTSPVVRGKWVLDNLLGAPPPPMPNNVPPLDETAQTADGKVLTMRERMEVHRRNPVCANCHRIMDPIGLALENFDAVGRWRTRDGGTLGTPIDASGVLLDGTTVDGVVSLREALLRDPEIFVGTVVEKLMTYALGRGVTHDDMPTVRAIVRHARADGYRFSSLLDGIVSSPAFQMRRATGVGELRAE